MKAYKSDSEEFKLKAIRMIKESDGPTSEIAMQLGIRRNQLYKWKEQMAKKGDASGKKGGASGHVERQKTVPLIISRQR